MTLRKTFDQAWDEVTARATCVVQEKEELFALAALMQAEGVRSYLELGASEGVSLYCLGMCLPKDSRIWALDLCEVHSEPYLMRNIDLLRESGQNIWIMKGTTQQHSSFRFVDLDAILIDAGHTYEEVKADWEMYKDLGKMVIFHDIRLPPVQRFWFELRRQHRSIEIHSPVVTVNGGENMGFGVVWPR